MGKNINPKRVGIFFVAIIVLVAILAPVAYFATRSDKRKDTGKSNNSGGGGDNTQQPRAPEKQTQRIDCFPENVGVTKDKCKSRNCLYESSAPQPGVPSCFFPVNKDYGFSADKRTTYTPLGFRVKLQQKGTTPFEPRSKKFMEPTFEVEYLGENLIRFKVCVLFLNLIVYTMCVYYHNIDKSWVCLFCVQFNKNWRLWVMVVQRYCSTLIQLLKYIVVVRFIDGNTEITRENHRLACSD